MNATVLAPVLIPMCTAILCIALWTLPKAQRAVSLLGAFALLASSVLLLVRVDTDPALNGVAAVQLGNWAAPFGISFVADRFAAIMVLLNGMIGAATAVYALGGLDKRRESFGFHALFHGVLCAVSGAFLTGDIFNMFVWFEVMLLSSFVLLCLGGERAQLEGAVKYVALNLLSSGIFLAGVGLLYGLMGTLNMADLSVKIGALDEGDTMVVTAVGLLFLVSFGIKAAAFPFFFWLPASYHTPPTIVSALFAGLLTKVGVYALVRTFTLVFGTEMGFTHNLIVWIAGATMVTGVLGAAAQYEIRRILSFHIVSQIGYMLMGLGVFGVATARAAAMPDGSPEAQLLEGAALISLTGTVFYVLHHIIVKTNLFFVSGLIEKIKGSTELSRIGGLYHQRPWLAVLFFIPAMSLAGIPILSGFWSKLALVRGGLQAETYGIVTVSLLVSILTLFSMTKIWANAFWAPQPEDDPEQGGVLREPETPDETPEGAGWMALAITGLAAVTVAIGVLAGPAFDLAERAASQLVTNDAYIEAVLTGTPSEDTAALLEASAQTDGGPR